MKEAITLLTAVSSLFKRLESSTESSPPFFPEIDKEEYVAEAKTIFDNTTAATEGKVLKLGGIK